MLDAAGPGQSAAAVTTVAAVADSSATVATVTAAAGPIADLTFAAAATVAAVGRADTIR
ncbi:hypothetical protein [Mycolicibacterium neoaurum]|uniref:hypothetical protein n=1 Tax=Mycolicibacterium neoaurum TaxID=1795 RepID=UPI0013157F43|nr:hypothetical protein [Mycolicibacterium neoaurum]